MFERFTERARQVVVLAQDEARSLGHDYIGTEHLLLGLLREEEGIAARVLVGAGVALDDLRARVEGIVGRGPGQTTGQIPFTPRAKRVLELGLREALSLGHNHIGTEHVLLGLLRANGGVAAVVLGELGHTPRSLAHAVLERFGAALPDAAASSFDAAFSGGVGQEDVPPPAAGPHHRAADRVAAARERWLPLAYAVAGGALALAGVLVGWLVAQ